MTGVLLTPEQARHLTALFVEHREDILALPGVRQAVGDLSAEDCAIKAPMLHRALSAMIEGCFAIVAHLAPDMPAAVERLAKFDWYVQALKSFADGSFKAQPLN